MVLFNAADAINIGSSGGTAATWGDASATWGDASATWGAGPTQAADRVYLGATLVWPAQSYVVEPYGVAYNLDALQNVEVGSSLSRQCSQRFRAQKDASITTVMTWLKNYPGYGLGNGGTIRASIQTDNGSGLPSGTVLGYDEIQGPGWQSNNVTATWTFDTPVDVTADTLYHVVYTNTAADPVNNFCSVNNTLMFDSYDPYQPRVDWADNSFDTLAKTGGGPWVRFYNSTPMLDVGFSDGTHYGSYIYNYTSGVSGFTYGVPFSGATMLRMRFTVSGADRLVGGIAFRFAKMLTNTGSSDVTARLEQSDGTLIEAVTLAISGVNAYDQGANDKSGEWVTGAFTGNRTLTSGTTYNVRFDVNADTTLWTRAVEWGLYYGADNSTGFADGYAQRSTDSGASWAYLPGMNDDAGLQWYMTPGT